MGDDGKGFSVEDQVYPITKNVEEQNSTVLLKKLTRYFDSKKMEYKDQPNIKFLLKVTNPKLDEIAKDEKSRVEFKEYLGHSYIGWISFEISNILFGKKNRYEVQVD